MRCILALFALVAFATAIPPPLKQRAADQETLKKQHDVIQLLQQVTQQIPNEQLQILGTTYDIESNYHQYENPIIVKYYVGAVKAGLVQPKGTAYSNSVPQIRKEVSLLTQVFMGAKDYQTFLNTAAWAHVHVNEVQFVKAFLIAVLGRQDTQGIIVPPLYEIFPQYHLDARIIQEAQNFDQQGVENVVIPVNYTAHLPHGEHQLSYFTQDVGLGSYYGYLHLGDYIGAVSHQQPGYQQVGGQYKVPVLGQEQQGGHLGHGSRYYYLHQQLLAHYELNRLSNGLGPISNLEYHAIKAPYQPHFRHLNGLEFPGRPEILEQPHKQELINKVHILEQRLLEAIDSGRVITPQGAFLSLYQPQGLNILGDLIQGTGKSVNPKYYGSLQLAAHKLLGNAPQVQNIWDYTPSALELHQTAVHDPAFYQLLKKVIKLFHQYQESLPAYQYNDLVLPGVNIENVDISELVTIFSDYYVNLDGVLSPVGGHHHGQQQQQQQQQESHNIKAHLKRLDHKPYQYQITVNCEQKVPEAVFRVYLGPKHDYEGKPISISEHRHQFVELDQFVHELQKGQNVIVRHSHQAPGKSHDYPSIHEIQQHVNDAIRSQEPLYITEPHQIFSFPARLSLPKGHPQGLPLQLFVVISGPNQPPISYGPVVPQEQQSYQPPHYQVVGVEEYQTKQQVQDPQVPGVHQTVEVIPENLINGQQKIEAVRTHYAQLYTKHHGQYPYAQIHTPIGEGVQAHGIHGQQVYGQYAHGPQEYQQYGQQGQQYVQGQVPQLHVQQGQQEQQVPHGQQGQQYQYQPQQPIFHGQQHIQQQPIYHGQKVGYQQQQPQQQPQQQQQQYHIPQQQPIVGQVPIHGGQYGVQGQVGVQGIVQGVQGIYQSPQGPIVGSGQQHAGGYQGIYSQGQIVQDQSVNDYYQGKHISEIIGGTISYDGKPFGYPFDRPLTPGALFVPNIYVKDVLVYHEGQPTNEVVQ